MLQALESRRFLSVTINYEPTSGSLEILGTPKAEQIEVSLLGQGSYPVIVPDVELLTDRQSTVRYPPPGTSVSIRAEGKEVFETFFGADRPLNHVVLSGDGGDDLLAISNSANPAKIVVYGDEGADQIVGFSDSIASGSELFGGDGKDRIHAFAGKEAGDGFFISGDAGDDLIFGSRLDDRLYGDSDWDPRDVDRGSGDDTIFAGAGNDLIYGGDGADALFGEQGDDFIDGGRGVDLMHGGDGWDNGICDQPEQIIDIEEVIILQPTQPTKKR